MNFGDLLEAANGVWAVLAAWLSLFLIYHLAKVRVQRRISWRRVFSRLPLSMQLAVGMLVVAMAIFVTRAVIWWARYRHSGDLDLLMPETAFYLIGTGIGIVGFLCILRTVSQPTFGHWPWVGALVTAAVYLFVWGIRFV